MGKMLDLTVNLSMVFGGQGAFTQAAKEVSQFQQQISGLAKASGMISGYQKQSASLTTLRQKLDTAREKVRSIRTEMRNGANDAATRRLFTKANEDAARLSRQVQENVKRLGEFRSALKGAGVDTLDLAGAQAKLQQRMDSMKAAQERLARAQSRYQEIRSKLTWSNMQGDIMASLGTIKAFQAPVTVSMNYEQAMSSVKAVSNPTENEYQQLRQQSLTLGRTTQYSAIQAANSQEVLMRAGLSVSQVLDTLPAVLSMASAEGMEISQAADYLVNSVKGMKLDVSLMPVMSDVLAYTSSHSNTNIAQLAEAMSIAAPIASDIGMSMEELAALLGAASSTVRGSEAGTAISSTISRLAKSPKQVTDALQELGVATRTREGKAVKIPEILLQVERKLSRMGKMDAANYRSRIYGQFAPQMSGLTANIINGDYKALELGAYTERDGTAQRMSSTRNDNLAGDITALSSAWEGFMESIGNPLQDWGRGIVQTLTECLNGITKFIKEHETLAEWAIKIGAAFGGYKVLSTAWTYGSLLLKLPWAKMAVALAEGAAKSGALAPAFEAASTAIGAAGGGGLIAKILALLGPIGMVSAAVYTIYTYWDDITAACSRAGEVIMGIKTRPMSEVKRTDDDYGIQAMLSTYAPPGFATGGIIGSHSIIQVAENGPEAIIPLTDRTRGVALLHEAASRLGVHIPEQDTLSAVNTRLVNAREEVSNNVINQTGLGSVSPRYSGGDQRPQVNITVNANTDADAYDIAQKVREELDNWFSYKERVSYA